MDASASRASFLYCHKPSHPHTTRSWRCSTRPSASCTATCAQSRRQQWSDSCRGHRHARPQRQRRLQHKQVRAHLAHCLGMLCFVGVVFPFSSAFSVGASSLEQTHPGPPPHLVCGVPHPVSLLGWGRAAWGTAHLVRYSALCSHTWQCVSFTPDSRSRPLCLHTRSLFLISHEPPKPQSRCAAACCHKKQHKH